LTVQTTVNGEVMQSGSTALMVCGVAELVAAASELTTLEPGDVIATGTPAGVGAGRGRFLAPGDVVEVTIAGVGRVRNQVRVRGGARSRSPR
jgi:2-keto-4-pentenoate hydratase/2-oxohepta-3-ene-1,7-dioic acid hydratase in catechol pathway